MSKINISIKRNGHARGTIGWLAANAASIKIGESQKGKQGAWLVDHEGKTITPLAIRGMWDDDEIHTVRKADFADRGYDLTPDDIVFTDAAWAIIEQIIPQAVAAMQDGEEASAAAKYSIEIKE